MQAAAEKSGMRRRDVLAGASIALLAGCLTGGDSPSNGGTSPPPGATTTATPTVDNSFLKIPSSGCGSVTERADVSVDQDELRVLVDGTTSAESACYTARLAEANYDGEADKLQVIIETYDSSEGESCAQCITEFDYVATVEFSGALPGSVAVVHRTRGEEREVTSVDLDATSTSLDGTSTNPGATSTGQNATSTSQ